MRVRIIADEFEFKLSPIMTRRWPNGWTGEMADEIAAQAILSGHAEDPSGEITREAIVAEIEQIAAAPAGSLPADASDAHAASAPEDLPAGSAQQSRKAQAKPRRAAEK